MYYAFNDSEVSGTVAPKEAWQRRREVVVHRHSRRAPDSKIKQQASSLL